MPRSTPHLARLVARSVLTALVPCAVREGERDEKGVGGREQAEQTRRQTPCHLIDAVQSRSPFLPRLLCAIRSHLARVPAPCKGALPASSTPHCPSPSATDHGRHSIAAKKQQKQHHHRPVAGPFRDCRCDGYPGPRDCPAAGGRSLCMLLRCPCPTAATHHRTPLTPFPPLTPAPPPPPHPP